MVARAFALGVAAFGLVACQDARSMVGSNANPLLQTREGRREIVSLCHEAVVERTGNYDNHRFAVGNIINTDDSGDAIYHGAVEGLSGGHARRFAFICTVQPSGAIHVLFR
jgi:hypothetical protein